MTYCTRCGHEGDADEVEPRWSFGIYAGRLCISCCSTYRDNCGMEREDGSGGGQGDPADLEEEYYGE